MVEIYKECKAVMRALSGGIVCERRMFDLQCPSGIS